MNFLFDLIASQPNPDGEYHGGGKYAKKIFITLVNALPAGTKLFAIFDQGRRLDGEIRRLAESRGITLLDVRNSSVSEIIVHNQINRLYSALPFGLIRYGLFDAFGLPCEFYCTIHGLRNLEVKADWDALKYFSATDFKGKLNILAKNIGAPQVVRRDMERYRRLFEKTTLFTVSDHTKYSMIASFPRNNKAIEVFYSPDVTDLEDLQLSKNEEEFAMSNYFLLISGNRWLKNNMRSIMALDQVFSDFPNIHQKVVVTGVSNADIFLKKIKNPDRFVFLGYVSEAFLRRLYQNAFAFIYMSLNEGFGYPPLDAMKAGKPVLTSPLTSIPEICGTSVLYANPYSILEIKNRILQLTDPAFYNKLAVAGKERFAFIFNKQQDDLVKMVDRLLLK